MISRIKSIYEYRDMVFSLVKRELRGRYQKSVLGMLWTFLNPLCQIVVYTFVFTKIFPSSIPKYYMYLMTGIIPWTFFTEALGQGTGSIVTNSEMTKKIYFPREVLTISSVTAKFINLLLAMIVVFVFLFLSGLGISVKIIWALPMVLLCEYMIALGLTLFFSAVTVYLRDMEYIVGVLLMAWIWATPIMYDTDMLTEHLVQVLYINPMTPIMIALRDILFYQTIPSIKDLIYVFAIGLVLVLWGESVFMELEGDFAEEL